ncbi:MAG: UvrD-helicase domain-containing protein [Chloroflexi bacterium]|nr:UvrD-helicase domain-containing protein [Chloroflexota bacterium]
MVDILDGLNDAQREAVTVTQGPLLILAGPGSGKTRVIVYRVAYLIKVCGLSPRRILAVTFTNKAAREMKERLNQLLPGSAQELTVGTFHAFCARVLRTQGQHIGLDHNFVIYDDEDQLNLVKRSLLDLNLDPKHYPPRPILSAISAAKSQLQSPEDFAQGVSTYHQEVVRRVYTRYQELLRESKGVDFDDLLMQTVLLFQSQPSVLESYQSRYLHILVDEFQDTNIVQYLLAKQLAAKHQNLCVVGDPDQSIYSWRQADLRNILNFEKDYPQVRVVYLEQNYRSTQNILQLAQHVIASNQQRKPKNLWTLNPSGTPITMVQAYNEDEEAQFVISEVERLMKDGFQPKDCAVMYRVNAQSRSLEEAFLRYGMPYKLVGGIRFYERREVKDIIAYLRLIHNPYDNLSLARVINVPGRGIGTRTVEQLFAWARQKGLPVYTALQLLAQAEEGREEELNIAQAPSLAPRSHRALMGFLNLANELMTQGDTLDVLSLMDLILEKTGYREYLLEAGNEGEERWDNILELRSVAREHAHLPPQEGRASFLESVALVSDQDELDVTANAVTLITLHAAKGLEFPVVFIVGMEEGLLPHFRSLDDVAQLEEERRLCYVGMTRAKKELYLVRALRRSLIGSSGPTLTSRFIKDLPSNLVRYRREGEERKVAVPSRPAPRPTTTFSAGDRVRHSRFGEGVVVNCTPARGDQEIVVAFKGPAGIKKLLLSFAPLEKVP